MAAERTTIKSESGWPCFGNIHPHPHYNGGWAKTQGGYEMIVAVVLVVSQIIGYAVVFSIGWDLGYKMGLEKRGTKQGHEEGV